MNQIIYLPSHTMGVEETLPAKFLLNSFLSKLAPPNKLNTGSRKQRLLVPNVMNTRCLPNTRAVEFATSNARFGQEMTAGVAI